MTEKIEPSKNGMVRVIGKQPDEALLAQIKHRIGPGEAAVVVTDEAVKAWLKRKSKPTLLQRLIRWWRRPPADQRILAALSTIEWRRSLDIINAANVSIVGYYSHIFKLEADGIVESKWDEGPIPPARRGKRARLYRRVK